MPGICTAPVSAICLFAKPRAAALPLSLAEEVGHIEGEEVARVEESIDGGEADVIGVDMIGGAPAERGGREIRLEAHALWHGVDHRVLSVRLVPHRHYLDAARSGHEERAELGAALMPEAIADAHGKLADLQHVSVSLFSSLLTSAARAAW
ncbi:MAG: hypothetical protein QM820_40160 [Minicystis sp.]